MSLDNSNTASTKDHKALPIFMDQDCDLGFIRDKNLLIIGYGSQGRSQALNARDSGIKSMRIALKAASPRRKMATQDGFEIVSVKDGVSWADVIVVLASDEAHKALFLEEISPNLRSSQCLIFAHGLSVHFGLVAIRPDVDIVLVSPKGIGPRNREVYQAGEGVFALYSVHHDATGFARSIGLAYAVALGCGRKGIIETTFKDECECDLFGEQVVLCGGVRDLVESSFETLIQSGYPAEVAWFETFYELKLVVDLMWARGMHGAFGAISNTAEYGAYLTGPRIIDAKAREAMQTVLMEVQSGDFVNRLMKDYESGSADLLRRRTQRSASLLDQIGTRLGHSQPIP